MAKNINHLNLDSVESCSAYLGVDTPNKFVNVINLDAVGTIKYIPKKMGVYGLACCWNDNSDTSARLSFYTPGYSDVFDGNQEYMLHGWAIVFDPKLLDDTLLANRMSEYRFFSANTTNMIRLNSDERNMIINCMQSIRMEIFNSEDKFTKHIITAGIAAMLNLCMRYYELENNTPQDSADVIVSRFNKLICDYLSGARDVLHEFPTVSSCAEILHISPNYLGDVVRKKLKCSAQQHIRQMVVKEAAYQLRYSNTSISEIGYNLGFKYPHHFTRVFKHEFGTTPNEYRHEVTPHYKAINEEKK